MGVWNAIECWFLQRLVFVLTLLRVKTKTIKTNNNVDIKAWFFFFFFFFFLVWFDFCFTALRHILGNFGRGQLT